MRCCSPALPAFSTSRPAMSTLRWSLLSWLVLFPAVCLVLTSARAFLYPGCGAFFAPSSWPPAPGCYGLEPGEIMNPSSHPEPLFRIQAAREAAQTALSHFTPGAVEAECKAGQIP